MNDTEPNPKPEINKPRIHDQAWHQTYSVSRQATPSWNKHGMPYVFNDFIKLVNDSSVKGDHLDIGCGEGTKTIVYAEHGLSTIGIDLDPAAIEIAKTNAFTLGVQDHCKFKVADAIKLPVQSNSIASASDSLMFTHLEEKDWKEYGTELDRVLKSGAYMLFVLFSDKDTHFHGHPVSKRYYFDSNHPNIESDFPHKMAYHNMYNIHFNKEEIEKVFGGNSLDIFPKKYELIKMVEVGHPIYPHRKLWDVIIRKPLNESSIN